MNKENWLVVIICTLFVATVIFLALQQEPKDRYFLITKYTKETVVVDSSDYYYYSEVDSSYYLYSWKEYDADTVEVYYVNDSTKVRR